MISVQHVAERAKAILRAHTQNNHRELSPDAYAAIQALIEAISNTRPGWPPYPAQLEPTILNTETYTGWQATIQMPRHDKILIVTGNDLRTDYHQLLDILKHAIPQETTPTLSPLGAALSTTLNYKVRNGLPYWEP